MIELILTGPLWIKVLFMLLSIIGTIVIYRFKWIVLTISVGAVMMYKALTNKGK